MSTLKAVIRGLFMSLGEAQIIDQNSHTVIKMKDIKKHIFLMFITSQKDDSLEGKLH